MNESREERGKTAVPDLLESIETGVLSFVLDFLWAGREEKTTEFLFGDLLVL
jgi:hypothetical protein